MFSFEGKRVEYCMAMEWHPERRAFSFWYTLWDKDCTVRMVPLDSFVWTE